ncbi:MAG: hypothetical protein DYG92_01355 [Leptolyngbya sp. PLA1]|nr:hypothetical protein [Leptolyngbya sp. PLA1]
MMLLGVLVTALVAALVLIDLFGIHRGYRAPTARNEWRTAGLYALLAMAFGGLLSVAHGEHWFGIGSGGTSLSTKEAFGQFLGAFGWQLALDLDTVFVVTALFVQFKTPREVQHRVLLWGVLLGMFVRGALTAAGAELLQLLPWTRFVISGFLVLAALRMLVIRQENLNPANNVLIRMLRRVVPVAPRAEGAALFTRVGGRLAVTPLLILVVLLETADAFMAMDSIPAVLAISRDPLLVYSANAFALLCLRSLYMALRDAADWLRYCKIGLACSLGYAAVLMSLPTDLRPTTLESVAVLVLSVAAGTIIGIGTKGARTDVSPLGESADRMAKATLRHARRTIALVLGVTLLAVGVFFVIAPGPGLPVIFIGLAILGNEFAWARRFADKYRAKAEEAVQASAVAARKRFGPWVLVPLVVGTAAVFMVGGHYLRLKPHQVALGLVPAVLGQLAWGYFTFFRGRKGGSRSGGPEGREPQP